MIGRQSCLSGCGGRLGVVFVVLIHLSERLLSARPLLPAAATPVSPN